MDPTTRTKLSLVVTNAARAVHAAYVSPTNAACDLNLQNSIISLLQYLQQRSLGDCRQPAFAILIEECTTRFTEGHFSRLLHILVPEMSVLGNSAYARGDSRINFEAHLAKLEDAAALLSHQEFLTHQSSAFGVLSPVDGNIQPCFQGSKDTEILAGRFLSIARSIDADKQCFDGVICEVICSLIKFFEQRCGVVDGIPYGIPGGGPDTQARDLWVLFKYDRWHWSVGTHFSRVHTLKLAQYLIGSLTRMYAADDQGFNTTRDDIQVFAAQRFLSLYCRLIFLIC